MRVDVEVYLKTELCQKGHITDAVRDFINSRENLVVNEKLQDVSLPGEVSFLRINTDNPKRNNGATLSFYYHFVPPLEPATASEEFVLDGENSATSSFNWILPNANFDGLWESLYLPNNIKRNLLRYAMICLEFGQKNIDPNIVLCNRLIFLHGPPGTGKTTICKALAQKLSIRHIDTYPTAQLIEINCHSLLSKWFSESGKLVTKLFENIRACASSSNTLITVLVDEVESLTFARQSAAHGNEPSDAIRVVNAVLTQLDSLRLLPNVLVLATSNLSDAIDPAFKDRADFIQLVGLPTKTEIYDILSSCCCELKRVGILTDICQGSLKQISELCVGLSGRTIRKLPMLALALADEETRTCANFMEVYLPLAVEQAKTGAHKTMDVL